MHDQVGLGSNLENGNRHSYNPCVNRHPNAGQREKYYRSVKFMRYVSESRTSGLIPSLLLYVYQVIAFTM
jgi:hypothetical protein